MARLKAGVRKRDNGTLEKRVTIEGKRYSIYAKSQEELQAKEIELQKQIVEGNYTRNKNITLDKYYIEWLKEKRADVKANSIRSYIITYNTYIKPILGSRVLRYIEKREVLYMRDEVLKEHSTTTANYVVTVLKMILKNAVDNDIISKNACAGIKPLKNTDIKASESTHRALTIEEQKAFMQAFKDDYYYEFVALLLLTGMRCGEAGALTWNDIDYDSNVIHIKRTMTRDEAGNTIKGKTPKSDAGARDIPMNEAIKSILAMQKKKIALQPIADIERNVFLSPYGYYVTTKSINEHINKTLFKMAENGFIMDKITAHAFRDTFATRYIEQGGTMQVLKTILGHSSINITMDLYSHVLPNTKQAEMDKISIVI